MTIKSRYKHHELIIIVDNPVDGSFCIIQENKHIYVSFDQLYSFIQNLEQMRSEREKSDA